jgi:hypothetical protein
MMLAFLVDQAQQLCCGMRSQGVERVDDSNGARRAEVACQ